MKKIRVISVILFVIIGLFSQFKLTAQEDLIKIQQDNLKFYQQRESGALQEIKTQLQSMRELIKAKQYTFEVGYTSPMNYTIDQITGMVEPPDLNDQIIKQNEIAKQKMQTYKKSVTLGTCSAQELSFDWRKNNGTTPVRDQENCGSCWAFGTCGAYEANYRIINSLSRDVSEQQILDCNPWGYSCSGGWWAYKYFIDHGVARETDYHYTAVKGTCNNVVISPYKAVTWGYVGSSSGIPSIGLLKQALCEHGPLGVALYATSAFHMYTTGVLNENHPWTASTNHLVNVLVKPSNNYFYVCINPGKTGPTQPVWPLPTVANPHPIVVDGSITWKCMSAINHAVTLIGWDDGKKAWLIKNSWGPNWGDTCGFGTERGYIWISYACDNVGYAATWVEAVKCTGCSCP
jgi:hypothetical protein